MWDDFVTQCMTLSKLMKEQNKSLASQFSTLNCRQYTHCCSTQHLVQLHLPLVNHIQGFYWALLFLFYLLLQRKHVPVVRWLPASTVSWHKRNKAFIHLRTHVPQGWRASHFTDSARAWCYETFFLLEI